MYIIGQTGKRGQIEKGKGRKEEGYRRIRISPIKHRSHGIIKGNNMLS
jgi:hypothetical protein